MHAVTAGYLCMGQLWYIKHISVMHRLKQGCHPTWKTLSTWNLSFTFPGLEIAINLLKKWEPPRILTQN